MTTPEPYHPTEELPVVPPASRSRRVGLAVAGGATLAVALGAGALAYASTSHGSSTTSGRAVTTAQGKALGSAPSGSSSSGSSSSGSASSGGASSGRAPSGAPTRTPPRAPKPSPHLDGTVLSADGTTILIKDPEGFTRTIVTSAATKYRDGLTSSPATGTQVHADGTVDANGTSLDATSIGKRPSGPPGAGHGPRPPAGAKPPAGVKPPSGARPAAPSGAKPPKGAPSGAKAPSGATPPTGTAPSAPAPSSSPS